MIFIDNFIKDFSLTFPDQNKLQPWELTSNLKTILEGFILQLDGDYNIMDGIAIHKTAQIESGVVLKRPVIITENCVVAANAYLR